MAKKGSAWSGAARIQICEIRPSNWFIRSRCIITKVQILQASAKAREVLMRLRFRKPFIAVRPGPIFFWRKNRIFRAYGWEVTKAGKAIISVHWW